MAPSKRTLQSIVTEASQNPVDTVKASSKKQRYVLFDLSKMCSFLAILGTRRRSLKQQPSQYSEAVYSSLMTNSCIIRDDDENLSPVPDSPASIARVSRCVAFVLNLCYFTYVRYRNDNNVVER